MTLDSQDPQKLKAEPAPAGGGLGTDRYENLREIGSGGMGAVYEAFDRERRHPVALKTLLHFSPAALYRFKKEFRALCDVVHPNLVRLYELVATPDRVFFTMELVRGTDFITYAVRPEIMAAREAAELLPTSTLPRVRAGDREVVDHRRSPVEPSRHAHSPANLDRLRPALLQLVEGVDALHSAGKLHRDIKPSNVLCTPEGRVVLLDFGVSTDLVREQDDSLVEREVVGTARYMAPEQATDGPPVAASDWYSVGVMLYQALVGRAPFAGSAAEILTQKNAVDPPAPSECVEGVPADLDALCCALLHRDPEARPTGREILRWLEQGRASGSVPPPPPSHLAARSGLIGRDAELRALREALDVATQEKRPVTVRVHGGAGTGKAFLVESFLDDLVERGEVVVLRGRAYERESVPYKALDSVVDSLSRYLTRLADEDAAIQLPFDIGALARIFPVLRRVESIAEAPEPGPGLPQAIRRRAIAALRELLRELGARQPIVLHVADAHWGDSDSAALLVDLVRPPLDAALLVILSYRDEEADASSFLVDLRARWPMGAHLRDVALLPLEHGDARTLALSRLGATESGAFELADSIAREAAGNPLLVDELARVAGHPESSVTDLAAAGTVRLDEVLRARTARLTDEARRLLQVIAVGGRPLPVATAGEAAEIREGLEDAVSALRERGFVRRGFRAGQEVVEMVHGRVGDTLVSELPRETVREYHRRIARVLEAMPAADPESLALHLLGAGEKEAAAKYAARAAEEAAKKLAFAQAVRLYDLAVTSMDPGSGEVNEVLVRLARTLEASGRGLQAALAYRKAAVHAQGLERVELERAAAEQLLTCGQIDEGARALGRVLDAAGMWRPHTVLSALLWGLALRVVLRVVGLRFRERSAEEVDRVDHVRIEALYAVVIGLAFVNAAYGISAQARHVLLALRRGDRRQIMRAAAMESVSVAARGGPETAREREFAAIADRLTESIDDPDLRALRDAVRCLRLFLRGEWKAALFGLDELYDNYPVIRAGWHSNAHLFSLWALAFLGRMAELRLRLPARLADAEERGDLYTSVSLRIGHSNAVWLAADEVDVARKHLRDAMAVWSESAFFLQHYRAMLAEASIELYAGDGARAYDIVARAWPKLRRSLLMLTQYVRADALYLRARCAIADAAGQGSHRAARIAEAARLARRLRTERMPWTEPLAAIVTAAVAHARGDRAATVAALRETISRAEAADMLLHAAAARLQLGKLLGGDEGGVLEREALEWMAAQQIVAPARFAAMLVPGIA
jgi:serine/threonine protein kinase